MSSPSSCGSSYVINGLIQTQIWQSHRLYLYGMVCILLSILGEQLWNYCNSIPFILWDSLNQTPGVFSLWCFLRHNEKATCRFRVPYQGSSHPRRACGWGTHRACLSLPTAGLVETFLYRAMALLTLHRLPSISAPQVSPVHPMRFVHTNLFLLKTDW